MFCDKCGSQIQDGSSVCPICGNVMSEQPMQQSVNQAPVQQALNSLATGGLVLGIISAAFAVICWIVFWWLGILAIIGGIVGIALSAVGMSRAKKMNGTGKNAALAGLITSIVGVILAFAAIIYMAVLIAAIVG